MGTTTVATPSSLDGLQIDLDAPWEVAYWTRKLEVTEADLRRAVQAAGPRLASAVGVLLVEKHQGDMFLLPSDAG